MKSKLLVVITLFSVIQLFSQTDGWYQIDKPQTLNTILPDDVDPNIIHIATNIGYIKYNINTSQVVDFLNITSQNPAIGNAMGLALNPTNNEIAIALTDGIAVYNGTAVTKYTYDNSNLTVGQSGFQNLKIKYNPAGELYIFKSDVNAYQVFSGGIFQPEVALTFPPQDIEESVDGTKIFFATWNTGLEEYTKATTSFTTHTTSNSSLLANTPSVLFRNSAGTIFVGCGQGFNTIDSGGVWGTFQDATNFFAAFSFSENSSGDILVNSSRPNTSYANGFCVVDLSTNTWTNYKQNDANCVNKNSIGSLCYGANDNIYVSPFEFFGGYSNLLEFIPTTDTCSNKDINYLNGPDIGTYASTFAVRSKPVGSGSRGGNALEVVFQNNSPGSFSSVEIDPLSFNGSILNTNTYDPPPGNSLWDVDANNDVLFFETDTGILLNHPNGTEAQIDHGLAGYQSLKIKTAQGPGSPDIVEVVQRGTLNGDHKLFTNQIDLTKNTSTPLQEITFPSVNVNPSQGFRYGFIKKDDSGSNTSTVCTLVPTQGETNPTVFCSESNSPFTSPGTVIINELLPFNPASDPAFFQGNPNTDAFFVAKDNTTLTCGILNPNTNSLELIDHQEDFDGDSEPDDFLIPFKQVSWDEIDQGDLIAKALCGFVGVGFVPTLLGVGDSPPSNNQRDITNYSITTIPITGASISDVPSDFYLIDFYLYPNSQTNSTMVLLTNYGLLMKTGIDVSSLLLNMKHLNKENLNALLYPNPSNDQVSFSSNKITTVKVYDINGRIVLEKDGNNFSVKALAKGIYIVKGQTDENQTISKKLIVN